MGHLQRAALERPDHADQRQERANRDQCWRRPGPVAKPRDMVRQRSGGKRNRSPSPAWQFDEHMIAPAGALPEDQLETLAKQRMRAVRDRDLTAGSIEDRGTIRGLVRRRDRAIRRRRDWR
jgi:hypothetical protein